MAPSYTPIALGVRMSDMGYWVVLISVAPGRRMSVMIAATGITPEQAQEHALGSFAAALAPRRPV